MDDQQLKALIKGEYGQAALQAKGGGSSCGGPIAGRSVDPIMPVEASQRGSMESS